MKRTIPFIFVCSAVVACDGNAVQGPVERPEKAPATRAELATEAPDADPMQQGLSIQEAEFAQEGALSAADRSRNEQDIIDAFNQIKEVQVIEPVQCRSRHCRLVIRVASEQLLSRILSRVFGPPTPDEPGPRLLKKGNGFAAPRLPEADGTVKAWLFINVL